MNPIKVGSWEWDGEWLSCNARLGHVWEIPCNAFQTPFQLNHSWHQLLKDKVWYTPQVAADFHDIWSRIRADQEDTDEKRQRA